MKPRSEDVHDRSAYLERTTAETEISLRLNLDGSGQVRVKTGSAFFDHALTALARHATFDLDLSAQGDTEVDDHHTVEDTGIVLGQAFARALGDKQGIMRFGAACVPMDEALILAAVDISGRGQLHYQMELPIEFIGSFDTSLAKEFFIAFATNAGLTLHIRSLAGENSHHLIEAAFKATARALRIAIAFDARIVGVPSTKGTL
jgi:imidazoleglycerol-phosphate dehydratase